MASAGAAGCSFADILDVQNAIGDGFGRSIARFRWPAVLDLNCRRLTWLGGFDFEIIARVPVVTAVHRPER